MCFLTIDTFVGIPVFIAKLSERQYCWRVRRLSKSRTYPILWHALLPLHCVCTSPLAVMTIVGLHDFVKVSISTSLRSFLLNMCIDAPESTTISRSSGFNVDAGKHLFSGDEKNVALWCSFNFKHIFGQLPRCFAGTLLLPLCLLQRSILKFWSVGVALMKFTWAIFSERRI